MKSILWIVAVLAICIVGVGFYRGWFAFSGPQRDAENRVNINLSVDPDKVAEDAETVKEKTSELAGKAAGEVKEAKEQVKEKLNSDNP
jgi:hypothetical protein